MNTLDWYPWHWKNWRLSEARESMNGIERGIYRELLDACWADGSVPDDLSALSRLCGHDLPTMQAAWPVVGRWFERRADGRLHNANMARIRAEQEARYAGFQKAGKKGAKKRWNSHPNGHPIAELKPSQTERKKEVLSEQGEIVPNATRTRPSGGGGPVAVSEVVGTIRPTGTDDGF